MFDAVKTFENTQNVALYEFLRQVTAALYTTASIIRKI